MRAGARPTRRQAGRAWDGGSQAPAGGEPRRVASEVRGSGPARPPPRSARGARDTSLSAWVESSRSLDSSFLVRCRASPGGRLRLARCEGDGARPAPGDGLSGGEARRAQPQIRAREAAQRARGAGRSLAQPDVSPRGPPSRRAERRRLPEPEQVWLWEGQRVPRNAKGRSEGCGSREQRKTLRAASVLGSYLLTRRERGCGQVISGESALVLTEMRSLPALTRAWEARGGRAPSGQLSLGPLALCRSGRSAKQITCPGQKGRW